MFGITTGQRLQVANKEESRVRWEHCGTSCLLGQLCCYQHHLLSLLSRKITSASGNKVGKFFLGNLIHYFLSQGFVPTDRITVWKLMMCWTLVSWKIKVPFQYFLHPLLREVPEDSVLNLSDGFYMVGSELYRDTVGAL